MGTICLALNIKRRAVTQYHGFDFNSFAVFNRVPVIMSDSGMYNFGYEYTDDNGTNIDAFAEFCSTDFGLDNHKHLRSTHVSYMSSGDLKLTWTADEQQERTENVLSETTGTNYRNVKVRGNRKVEGTYFQFKVENYRGSDFTINSIKTIPVIQNLGKSN